MADKKTYGEMLKDPRWQKVRLKVLERDEWACSFCFSTTKTLHVHHIRYLPGRRPPWESPLRDLQALCEDCHGQVSAAVAYVKERAASLDARGIYLLTLLLRGLEMVADETLESTTPFGVMPVDPLAYAFGLNGDDVIQARGESPGGVMTGRQMWELRRALLAKEPE